MWLICLVPCGSARIVRTHTMCCVMFLPSSGLWCFSQGWQRFYQFTSFIMWPHGHCSRSRVSQSSPGASKFLQSTLRCLSNAFQFMPCALQYFLARSGVTLLPRAQAPACSLWCVCLTHACNMSFFCWWLILCLFIWQPRLIGTILQCAVIIEDDQIYIFCLVYTNCTLQELSREMFSASLNIGMIVHVVIVPVLLWLLNKL